MQPDRELDGLIAERVFGLNVWREGYEVAAFRYWLLDKHGNFVTAHGPLMQNSGRVEVPQYSTDITAALSALEAVSDRFHWRIQSPFQAGGNYWVGVTQIGCSGWNGRADQQEAAPCLEGLPAAICRLLVRATEEITL